MAGGTPTQGGSVIEVHDGSTFQLRLTLTRDPGSLATGEADGVLVSFMGDPGAPTAAHFWPFAVMSRADAADAGVAAPSSALRMALDVENSKGGLEPLPPSISRLRSVRYKKLAVAPARFRHF